MEDVIKCPCCGQSDFVSFIETDAHMHGRKETFTFQQCKNCDLVFLNPRVKQESLFEYYGDHYLPYRGPSAWGRFAHFVESDLRKTDEKRVQLVKKHLIKKEDFTILDIGCGKPTFLKRLYSESGCTALGTDFSDSGWKENPGEWEGLKLFTGDIHELNISEQPDVITMWHYLEHDYDPGKTLRKVRDIASKDARLIIEVPNLNALTRKFQGPFWEGYHTPRHTAVYSPETLTFMLRKNGWEPVRLKANESLNPFALYWLGRQERKGIDWTMNMEKKFVAFVAGMLITAPLFALQRWIPLGVMTAVAKPLS